MVKQTAKQAHLMALIEQYANAEAMPKGKTEDEYQAWENRAEGFYRQIEVIVCAPQAVVIWPDPVAWRVHPHDYGVGTKGVHAITQMQHQRIVWACKDWKPEPLYTRAQIEAMLAKGQA